MSDLPVLSTMARKALEVLKEGGEFRHALEMSTYTRREQFKARLKTASGRTVRGIGVSTMYELKGHGLNSSSCSSQLDDINKCGTQG
jgi:hypothetical protein